MGGPVYPSTGQNSGPSDRPGSRCTYSYAAPVDYGGICLHEAMLPKATPPTGPRLELGKTVITSNAASVLPDHEVLTAMRRHVRGDWGEIGAEDWAANERALVDGTRVLSAYRSKEGIRFWIITEADRSATTVLLPEDY